MSDPKAPSIDPDVLMQLMSANPPKSAQELRAVIEGMAGLMNADLPEVGAFHEAVLVREVDGARVTADVVVPKGEGPHPVLVYLHGGGWVAGSSKTHKKLGYRFAEAGYLVFNVDYRLAPEHPFPAPYDDCLFAVRWAAKHATRYAGDPSRLAVGGDSAGGNLTAAVAATLADGEDVNLRACLLIYAALDFAAMTSEIDPSDPASRLVGDAQLAGDMIEIMIGSYLGTERPQSLLADPRVSPIHAAEKLPPSHLVVGTLDPLTRDSEAMAKKLEAARIEHEHVVVEGMPHGFVQLEFLPPARESIDRMVAFLDRHVR